MKAYLQIATLAAAAALAACAAPDAEITGSARGAEPRLAPAPACFEFNGAPLNSQWGGPPVNTPAYTWLWNENGITNYLGTFNDGVNPPMYGVARVELPPAPFGAGPTGLTRGIVWGFDFSTLPFVPQGVTLEWLDLYNMAVENLRVNGALYIGPIHTPPAALGGAVVGASSVPIGGGRKGTVKMSGTIWRIEVGGQLLWVDRICAYP
jgi:hypothetical protein